MLQILIWAVCAVMFGIGYLGYIVGLTAKKEGDKGNIGTPLFIIMVLLAIIIFYLSVQQGQAFRM